MAYLTALGTLLEHLWWGYLNLVESKNCPPTKKLGFHMFQPDFNIYEPSNTGTPSTPAKTLHKGSPHLLKRADLEMLQELATKERQEFGISQGQTPR